MTSRAEDEWPSKILWKLKRRSNLPGGWGEWSDPCSWARAHVLSVGGFYDRWRISVRSMALTIQRCPVWTTGSNPSERCGYVVNAGNRWVSWFPRDESSWAPIGHLSLSLLGLSLSIGYQAKTGLHTLSLFFFRSTRDLTQRRREREWLPLAVHGHRETPCDESGPLLRDVDICGLSAFNWACPVPGQSPPPSSCMPFKSEGRRTQ